MLRRAYPVSFAFLTARKRLLVAEICRSYQAAVNRFVRVLWRNDKITCYTQVTLRTRLSTGFLDDAFHQAQGLVKSARESAASLGVSPGRPYFKGKPTLGSNVVRVERGAGSFDLVIRLSVLNKGHKIDLPTKATTPIRERLTLEGAYLAQTVELDPDEPILFVASPPPAPRAQGDVTALDVGANVLFADSQGGLFFENNDFKEILEKIRRCEPGGKGRRRALAERDNYIRWAIKKLPWDKIRVLVLEDLKGIKKGKKKAKRLRKLLGPWNQAEVYWLLANKAKDEGILQVFVEAYGNSITCPACGCRMKRQRQGSRFRCRNSECGFRGHADTVGAKNAASKANRRCWTPPKPRHKPRPMLVENAFKSHVEDMAWQRPVLIKKAAKAALLSNKIQERGRERALAAKAKKQRTESKLTGSRRTATRGRRSAPMTLEIKTAPCAVLTSVAGAPAPGNVGGDFMVGRKAGPAVVAVVAGEITRPSVSEGGRQVSAVKSTTAGASSTGSHGPFTSGKVTSLGPVT